MKKSILAIVMGSLVIGASLTAHAQSPDEYRAAFQQNFRPTSIQERIAYGSAEVVVKVADVGGVKKAVLEKASGYRGFDNEVLRAANAAIKPTLQQNLLLPVTYTSPAQLNGGFIDPMSVYGSN